MVMYAVLATSWLDEYWTRLLLAMRALLLIIVLYASLFSDALPFFRALLMQSDYTGCLEGLLLIGAIIVAATFAHIGTYLILYLIRLLVPDRHFARESTLPRLTV